MRSWHGLKVTREALWWKLQSTCVGFANVVIGRYYNSWESAIMVITWRVKD